MGTFGKTTSTGTEDSTGQVSIYLMACRYSPALSGIVTSMDWYGHLDAAGHAKVAIYADNAGVPGALLAESTPVAVAAAFQWWHFPISVNVIGGTYYWLAFISDQGSRWIEEPGATNQLAYFPNYVGPYPAFPTIFPTPEGYSAVAAAIYATYTETGAVPPTIGISTPTPMPVTVGSPVTLNANVAHVTGADPTTVHWYYTTDPTTPFATSSGSTPSIQVTPTTEGSWEVYAIATDTGGGTSGESNHIIITSQTLTYTLEVRAEPEINVAFTITPA